MAKVVSGIIKALITSDFFLNLGWGLLSPIFAIFVLERIANNGPIDAAKIAGLAALSYWIPRSLLQIPVGIYLDKHAGEKDDFWFMFIGIVIASFIPIGFLLSSMPWHIYLLQSIYGSAMAISIPAWLAIFTRHIDKGEEAFEWSVEVTFLGTGVGIAGGLSGVLVAVFGFRTLLLFVSLFTMFTALLYLFIKNNISERSKGFVLPYKKKPITSH